MTNGYGRQKETLALKVFGGAVMAGAERKKNEGSGEWRRAESSIIEENLAAAERTMASFYPASIGDFLVDLITLRFSWRSKSLPEVKTFRPSTFFPLQNKPHCSGITSRLHDTNYICFWGSYSDIYNININY